MQTGLVHLHNLLRWVIMISLLFSIFKAYQGYQSKKAFEAADRKTWLITLIVSHLTLLLGIYQWLFGRYGIFSTTLPEGTSFMKDRFFRFYWMEHPMGMLLAIVLITLGYGMAKKSVTDETKYKKALIYFVMAMVLLLASVPWPFREIIGRPYFPGM